MATRRFAYVIAFSLSVASLLTALPLRAQTASQVNQPQVANSNYRVAGVVNATRVFVRSGPGENYYPTIVLDKGTEVVVVGQKFDWLKILPPEGSFSYVAKAFIAKQENGAGTVTRPDLLVRAGSALNEVKYVVQTKLKQDDVVSIIGERDEYYMIKPPADAYLFISKQFVDPVKVAAPGETPVATTAPSMVGSDQTPVAGKTETPTTEPAITANNGVAAAEAEFDKLEAQYNEASAKPLADQPVGELLNGYQALLKNDNLPVSMRRSAERHVAALKVNLDTQNQIVAARKAQEEFQQKQAALKAHAQEIEGRLKGGVRIFTAVGALQPSTLQEGTLFRLTDPANGRTLVYVRGEKNVSSFVGQFVGVRGEIANDQQLGVRIITPSLVEAVEPDQVSKGVVAQIAPPSLLPTAAPTTAPAK